MPHRFKVTASKNGEFVAKFVYNSETMVWSETYKAKASAHNCIESIKKHAPDAAIIDLSKDETAKGYRFELVASKDGQTFVRFVAANGETMVRSETYKSKSSAKNCIASIQQRAPAAETVDET